MRSFETMTLKSVRSPIDFSVWSSRLVSGLDIWSGSLHGELVPIVVVAAPTRRLFAVLCQLILVLTRLFVQNLIP